MQEFEHFFCKKIFLHYFALKQYTFHFNFVSLQTLKIKTRKKMNGKLTLTLLAGLMVLASCKEKKQTQDIIAPPRVENTQPAEPVRMQPYSKTWAVKWLGKEYKVTVNRAANDSLPIVKDEMDQEFYDNSIALEICRADGSVAISKTFTKATFEAYIDNNYRKAGILEGLVFDEVDGQCLEFAASVSLPQTDEYIPLEVKIDNFGNVKIERDSEMDTNGNGNVKAEKEDDES